MRRADREITDKQELIRLIEKCDVCRIALNDEEYPYILPLNFGMQLENGMPVFYFHGALEGKKYELIAKNPKASFEMDCVHELFTDEEKGSCSQAYESVIGRGVMEMVPEEKKAEGLNILMRHYHMEDFAYNPAVVPRTNVFKLTVSEMTGKRRIKKS